MTPFEYTPRRVVLAYVLTGCTFTLATSMIWAINTVFLIQRGHLTIFEVTLVNTFFLIAQAICEVPTGVVADTIGRRTSFLLAIAIISVSTVLYVVTPLLGWGLAGFTVGSVLLGLGFTFQTGAVDAWMVDALDASGFEGPKNRVFAYGMQASAAAMIVGSLAGGVLSGIDLIIPYLIRAGVLVIVFVMVLVLIHDSGFEPRPLALSNFGAETRKVFDAGTKYGWNSPVIRPMMFVSAVSGLAGMFVFYLWQPLLLQYLGNAHAYWLLGVAQSLGSIAGIIGAGLTGAALNKRAGGRRHPASVLALGSLLSAAGVLGIAAIGLLHVPVGWTAAGLAIALWLVWNLMFGLLGPIRSTYINEYIPSAQRATVLSLDSLFGDVGGSIGQPALGWISTVVGFPIAWAISAVAFAGASPLYLRSRAAANAAAEPGASE